MTTQAPDWPFADPRDAAVLTTRQVVGRGCPITFVGHDAADGSWQFHTGQGAFSPDDAVVQTLEEIVRFDVSVRELADLPLGWVAAREAVGAPWRRLTQAEWDRENGGG